MKDFQFLVYNSINIYFTQKAAVNSWSLILNSIVFDRFLSFLIMLVKQIFSHNLNSVLNVYGVSWNFHSFNAKKRNLVHLPSSIEGKIA
jgi:hypothetical protein